MKRALLLGVVAVLLGGSVAFGAPTINLKITTDKAEYDPGDTVLWEIYAWTAPAGNEGVALLGVNLLESWGEVLSPALTTGSGLMKRLLGGEYGAYQSYILSSAGTYAPGTPSGLLDILAYQMPEGRELGHYNDGAEHLFAQGSFTATVPDCWHTLSPSKTGANYWPNATDDALPFDEGTFTSASYEVTPEPATLSLLALGAAALFSRRRRT